MSRVTVCFGLSGDVLVCDLDIQRASVSDLKNVIAVRRQVPKECQALVLGLRVPADTDMVCDEDSYQLVVNCEHLGRELVRASYEGQLQALQTLAHFGRGHHQERAVIAAVMAKLDCQGSSGDEVLRNAAVEALRAIVRTGDQGVMKALTRRLASPHECLRTHAIKAMSAVANKGDAEVIAQVMTLLDHESEGTRRAAMQALVRFSEQGDERAISAVFARLTDEKDTIRLTAVRSLSTVAAPGDQRIAEALMERLTDASWEVREAAAEILGSVAERGNERVIAALAEQLKDEKKEVVWQVMQSLRTLAEQGDTQVIAAMTASLELGEECVRLSALKVLTAVAAKNGSDDHVISAVSHCLKDPVPGIKCAAAKYLAEFAPRGNESTTTDLIAMLDGRGPHVKKEALSALSSLACRGDSHVIAIVVSCLDDVEWAVRAAALYALSELSRQSDQRMVIEAMAKSLSDDEGSVREAAADALCRQCQRNGRRGNPDAIDVVSELLVNSQEMVRMAAVQVLTKVADRGDERVLTAVMFFLDHQVVGVRDTAVKALSGLAVKDDKIVVDALIKRLRDEAECVQKTAVESLCAISGAETRRVVVGALAGVLRRSSWKVRLKVVRALRQNVFQHDPAPVAEALTWCLDDQVQLVRAAAAQVLTAMMAEDPELAVQAAVDARRSAAPPTSASPDTRRLSGADQAVVVNSAKTSAEARRLRGADEVVDVELEDIDS